MKINPTFRASPDFGLRILFLLLLVTLGVFLSTMAHGQELPLTDDIDPAQVAKLAATPFSEWQLNLTTITLVLMILGRVFKALKEGGGLRGIYLSIVYGGNPPKDGGAGGVALLFLGLCLGCVGCKAPQGQIISFTQRVIGIDASQNPANQTPQLRLGFVSTTYHVVPSGSNVTAPAVSSSIDLDHKPFATGIHEQFSTGPAAGAAVPSNPAPTVIAND